MSKVLFDASIYIDLLRTGDLEWRKVKELSGGFPVWLSSVVLEELYAGVYSRDRGIVEAIERNFDRAGRILVPNLKDWADTGKLLALLGPKYDYEEIGRSRLTNDALIATSAGRNGITVITANARDFSRLAGVRAFEWRVENLKSI